MEVENLALQPYVPELYRQCGTKAPKLLLLGESHYSTIFEDPDTTTFTKEVVTEYVNQEWTHKYFTNIGHMFNPTDPREIWKRAAFANVIQKIFRKATDQPTEEDLAAINVTFDKLIASLKPDRVVVLSQRLWETWLRSDEKWRMVKEPYSVNGTDRHSNLWEYTSGDHRTYIIGINHPSSRGFSSAEWEPLIDGFMSESLLLESK